MMLKPLSVNTAEATYNTIIHALELENASVEDRIQRLLTITPEELVEKTPMTARLAPFLDDDILPEAITFEKIASGLDVPGVKWCEALMIGDCQHDVRLQTALFFLTYANNLHRAMCHSSWV